MEKKDSLKELCSNLDEIEFGAVEKFLENIELNEYEDIILKKLNKNNIEIQKNKISQADIENINIYISFFSLANVGKYEYSLLDKNLKIFKNIENIYYLVTPQSLELYLKEQKQIEKKYKDKTIKLIHINPNDYEGTYGILMDTLKDLDSFNEILIDNTLGPKMMGYSLYKLSIEQGIKLVTWQSHQIEGGRNRVPGSDTLNYIEFPQLKNSSLIMNINNNLDKYNFIEAQELAKSINNFDEANIFEEVARIFDINLIFSYYLFIEELEIFIENNYSKYKKLMREKVKKLKKEIKNYLNEDESVKKVIYLTILSDYFKNKFDNNFLFIDILLQNIVELLNITDKKYKEMIKNNLLGADVKSSNGGIFKGDLSELLFLMLNKNNKEIEKIKKDKFYLGYNFFNEILKYELPKNINLIENNLILDKYGITIDLVKEYNIRKDNYSKQFNLKNISNSETISKILLKTLLISGKDITSEEIENIIKRTEENNKTYDKKDRQAFNTAVSRINSFINEFNKFLYDVIKDNYPTKAFNFEKRDFIYFNRVSYETKRFSRNNEDKKLLIIMENKFTLRINSSYI